MSTRNEVDRVWAAMLDDPAPPLPTADEALQVARTSRRRHTALAVVGSGAAGALVIASVAFGVALLGTRERAPTVGDPAAVAEPVAPPAAAAAVLPSAPGRDEAHAHGPRSGAVLLAAVPSGYTGLLQRLSNNGPAATWQIGDGPRFVSSVYVIVTTGQADGQLTASIYGGVAGLGDDICSPAVTDYLDRLYETYPTTCAIVTVNGVQTRVSSEYDEARGTINRATRLLDGGVLTVEAQQGIPVYTADDNRPPDAVTEVSPADGEHSILGGWPALPAVPFTTGQLAAIAADPGLLP